MKKFKFDELLLCDVVWESSRTDFLGLWPHVSRKFCGDLRSSSRNGAVRNITMRDRLSSHATDVSSFQGFSRVSKGFSRVFKGFQGFSRVFLRFSRVFKGFSKVLKGSKNHLKTLGNP